MTIRVRLYGPAVDWTGADDAAFQVAEGATVGQLAGQIAVRWPRLGSALGVRLAVNRKYVALDHVLREGDEVAVIPPVSGG